MRSPKDYLLWERALKLIWSTLSWESPDQRMLHVTERMMHTHYDGGKSRYGSDDRRMNDDASRKGGAAGSGGMGGGGMDDAK